MLIDKTKIYLLSLHIKLGYLKQFVEEMNKDGEGFEYVLHKFTRMGKVKINEGIFVRPPIKQLFQDPTFKTLGHVLVGLFP